MNNQLNECKLVGVCNGLIHCGIGIGCNVLHDEHCEHCNCTNHESKPTQQSEDNWEKEFDALIEKQVHEYNSYLDDMNMFKTFIRKQIKLAHSQAIEKALEAVKKLEDRAWIHIDEADIYGNQLPYGKGWNANSEDMLDEVIKARERLEKMKGEI